MSRKISDRRRFLQSASAFGVAACAGTSIVAQDPRRSAGGAFMVGRRNNRWWLLRPDATPMFSLGLNHIDPDQIPSHGRRTPVGTSAPISSLDWLRQRVGPDLRGWGFNTVGWTQSVRGRSQLGPRLSRALTRQEYAAIGMPYGHMLPFWQTDGPGGATFIQDLRSSTFTDWCDSVAKTHCPPLRDDPNMVGYWYGERVAWIDSGEQSTGSLGPRLDPALLTSPAGRRELTAIAEAYHHAILSAVRRHDPNHLLLGDRYSADPPPPKEVVQAAVGHVDVLSFVCAGTPEQVRSQLTRWTDLDKPILVADHASDRQPSAGIRHHDASGYAKTLQILTGMPEVIGYHLCGAYIRDDSTGRGILDEQGRPDTIAINGIRRSNQLVTDWVTTASSED